MKSFDYKAVVGREDAGAVGESCSNGILPAGSEFGGKFFMAGQAVGEVATF